MKALRAKRVRKNRRRFFIVTSGNLAYNKPMSNQETGNAGRKLLT